MLSQRGADAYVSDGQADVRYFTGSDGATGVVCVTADGVTELIVAAGEAAAASASTTGTQVSPVPVGVPLEPLVAERLHALAVRHLIVSASGKTALDLLTAIASVARVDQDRQLGYALRREKSVGEQALLRRAASQCDAGLASGLGALRPGVTELEVVGAIEAAIRAAGADGTAFATNFASGPRSVYPNARPTGRKLALGDLGFIDLGPLCGGYHADAARPFVLGRPTRAQEQILDAILRALGWVLENVRPGMRGREVYHGVVVSLEASGFAAPLPHHAGHGLGLFGAEPPWMLPESKDELRLGDFLAIEPGVYVPGIGGARVEQNIVLTATGCELLTQCPIDPVVTAGGDASHP